MRKLLTEGRTDLLQRFISKKGRPFNAYLVKGPDGKVENWEVELGSPSALLNRGWKRDEVKEREVLVVEGFVFKDGTKRAVARTIKLPDGRALLVGSHAGDLTVKQ